MTTESLYSIPFYRSEVSNVEKIQQELKPAVESIEIKQIDDWGSPHKLSTVNFMDNFIEDYNLHLFKKEIYFHVEKYLTDVRFDLNPNYKEDLRVKINASWVSLFEKHDYAHIHDHGDADISGVYYYKVDNSHGDFFVTSPFPSLSSAYPFFQLSNRRTYKPKTGTIYLFPGFLSHGVCTNTSDETRISIAFNIYFERHVY